MITIISIIITAILVVFYITIKRNKEANIKNYKPSCPNCNSPSLTLVDSKEVDRWIGTKENDSFLGGKVSTTFIECEETYTCAKCNWTETVKIKRER